MDFSLCNTIISALLFFQCATAVDFVLNGFNSSRLLLYGTAALESRILQLTSDTTFTIGRGLYRSKVSTKRPNSSHVYPFSTSFIFSMSPYRNTLPGHGIVFLFVPFKGIKGATSSQNLGLFNRTNDGDPNNHVFGVEFDVFKNEEFNDIDDNHVGININSLKSVYAHTAGYYHENESQGISGKNISSKSDNEKLFKKLKLNSGKNYQVWIDYSDFVLNVTMAPAGVTKPRRPLLNVPVNLSEVLEEKMYVGFTGSTGRLVECHRILSWSFSNSNSSLSERLITTGLPSFALQKDSVFHSKVFIAGITIGGFCVIALCVLISLVLIKREQKRRRMRKFLEDWEQEFWPHRISYQEIEAATKGFLEENVIGIGGNGKVYKVVLEGAEVAVKRISRENGEGMREFLAEISSLGRLKHKNLVQLRGWCKKETGVFFLVYDYMENGSLDKKVFECDENMMLSCEERIRILKAVASGVLYLHEGWEAKVLHRDIKASNVLLDKEMNGRLGDFGLARLHDHGQVASTTRVVGTVGYMAPEVIRTGRASTQTDIYGFGILILEVMCGRRPIEEGMPPLVDWVLRLMAEGEVVNALDPRLKAKGDFDEGQVERVLHLGLLCAFPQPSARPSMRQVMKLLDGTNGAFESGIGLDAYIPTDRVTSKDILSNYRNGFSSGSSHPTFGDIIQPNSYSKMSVSWANSLVDGR